MRLEEVVKSLLLFGLLGPPIGGVVATVNATGLSNLSVLPTVMALSYIVGFVPALLVGALAAATKSSLSRWASVPLLTIGGAVFTVLFVAATSDISVIVDASTLKEIVLPGAISAFLLGSLYRLKA